MEYRTFEAILAVLHQVEPEDMGAFRARMRVLRDMGVPSTAKVGKGSRVEFSDDDLAEMHLALTMSEFGLPPARIVFVMGFVRGLPPWRERDADAEQWLVVTMAANAGKLSAPGNDAVSRIGIISTSNLISELGPPRVGKVTWHAVVSLQRIAQDLDRISSGSA